VGGMSNRELLSAIAVVLTIGTYAGWCVWSEAGRRWLRRKPTALEIPTLLLSKLPPNEEGYYRWARAQCIVLVLLAAIGIVLLIVSRFTR
jgi:hypothetical protein